MAIIQNPVTGRSRGKFANAVFSTWKDKNVMRSKALDPMNPNTVKQQEQRTKFKTCVNMLKRAKVFYLIAYAAVRHNTTEFSQAIKKFMKAMSNQPDTFSATVTHYDSIVNGDSVYKPVITNTVKHADSLEVIFLPETPDDIRRNEDKYAVLGFNAHGTIVSNEVSTFNRQTGGSVYLSKDLSTETENVIVMSIAFNNSDSYISTNATVILGE